MAVLERKSDNVEINGNVCESGFNIMASAEAFEILSDRIYPNKIKAVVRELTTNAVDATIDARKVSKIHEWLKLEQPHLIPQIKDALHENAAYVDKEIEAFHANPNYDLSNWVEKAPLVHLPNRVEPWFSIRDYGTGLSHDFVMKLYVSYFWSDKKTSNDYTGCLGLGSKSPFAYTDHFTVTSYWNGEKRSYNAHLSNGFPSISIFTQEVKNEETDEVTQEPIVWPTDEPNGIEVSFPVKSYDFDTFGSEARKLYPYFKMPLEIVGNSNVATYISNINKNRTDGTYFSLHSEKTVHWGFRRQNDYVYGNTGPQAIMGNIAYPIKLDYNSAHSGIVRKLLASNIDIVFPVGSLQITPSREQLSYKESTIKAIEVALTQIAEEIAEQLNKKIEDAPTLWEARCHAFDLFHKGEFSGFTDLLSLNKLKWNGKEIGSTLHINFEKEVDAGNVIIHKFDYNKKGRNKRQEIKSIPLERDILIYEIDLPRGSFSRCEILNGNKNKTVYALEFKNHSSKVNFIGMLGMDSSTVFPGTSTLPKPTLNQRATYANTSTIFQHSGSTWGRRQYQFWKEVNASIFNLSDGGVYVEMYRHQVTDKNGNKMAPDQIGDIISAINAIDPKNPIKVIGVRKKMVKEFEQSDDWVDLITYVSKLLKVKTSVDNIGVHIANIKEINRMLYKDSWDELITQITKFNDGMLKSFLSNIVDLNKSLTFQDNQSPYSQLANLVNYKFEDKAQHEVAGKVSEIIERYPMLKFIVRSDLYTADFPAVINYINSIDNQ